MADNVISIEILADGTIKSTTGDLTGPNHQSADDFLRETQEALGGEVKQKKQDPITKKKEVRRRFV